MIIHAVVKPDGVIDDRRFVLGECPNYWFGRRALETVLTWRFRSGLKDGNPTEVLANIEVTFDIR